MFQIQTVIHKIEVGGGLKYLKFALLPLILVALVVGFDFRGSKNLSSPEAMDAAQVARNLAKHKGFTTLYIRPLSIYLLKKTYADKNGPAPLGDVTDRGQLKSDHPDLANPPLYPLTLAALMKLSPDLGYRPTTPAPVKIGSRKVNLWTSAGRFWIYPPDFWIGIFNQVLLVGLAVMIFFIARRRFDAAVAWTSALIFLGTELFWRFSVSGLSTMMVMVIFLGMSWLMTVLEEKTRLLQITEGRQLLLAALIGLLLGMGCLTRYSFGWLVIPVIIFLVLFLGKNRLVLCLATVAVFVAVTSPWLVRNYRVSHTLFGVAGYSIYEGTQEFPEYRLERSLNPEIPHMHYWNKFAPNASKLLEEEIPKLGGGWIGAFFLVGLLIGFNNPGLGRLRYFVLLCLPVIIIVQSLGRTQLSEDQPTFNAENLLVLVAPLVIIFGVSLFFTLLDQIQFPIFQLRYPIIGAFFVLLCLPMIGTIFNVMNPFNWRGNALAYPPYYPPVIQQISAWMKPNEMIMSDIPWAMAWYGDHQCLWLTLNSESDFYEINDYQKPIMAIYLTPTTMDNRFLTQWIHGVDHNWGKFIYNREVPPNFPLKHAPNGFLPDQFFISDKDRWSTNTDTSAVTSQPVNPRASTSTTNSPSK